jgi:hypothetical protein
MQIKFASRRAAVIFTLAALPFLVGSGCFVAWSSGTSDEPIRDREDERNIIIASGQFAGPKVAGLSYASGSTSGVTSDRGEFEFEPGETVQFSIGDIALGPPVPAKEVMSTRDLVARDSDEGATSEVNMRRLLKSLDADPKSDVISISAAVQSAAVRSNEDVSSAIEFMDFSDSAAFANAASQLVAVLTNDYPFTATLLDAEYALPRTVQQ